VARAFRAFVLVLAILLPCLAASAQIQVTLDKSGARYRDDRPGVYYQGEKLAGQVRVIVQRGSAPRFGASVFDGRGKLLLFELLPLDGAGRGKFSFVLPERATVGHYLEIHVPETTLEPARLAFAVFRLGEFWNDFAVIAAPRRPPANAQAAQLMLSRGVSAITVGNIAQSRKAVMSGLRVVAADLVGVGSGSGSTATGGLGAAVGTNESAFSEIAENYRRTRDWRLLARKQCPSNPAVVAAIVKHVRTAALQAGIYRPLSYSAADGLSTTYASRALDACFCPYCMAAMRNRLKAMYTSTQVLNKAWGTRYRSWDDVRPWTVDEIRGREFAQGNQRWNFAPWADHMAFSDTLFANLIGKLNDVVLKADPQAPFGLTGVGLPAAYGGYDWSQLAGLVFWVEGPPLAVAIFRDCASGDDKRYISTAISVQASKDSMRRHEFWRGVAEDVRGAILRPPSDAKANADVVEALAGDLAIMRSGIGKLLSEAGRPPAEVGIVYSQPSFRAHWILDTQTGRDWMERTPQYEKEHSSALMSLDLWTGLLDDMGVPYEFISCTDLGAKRFRQRRFKVVILPEVLAVSNRQAAALTAFVSAGGMLVADSRAGLLDEHLVEGEGGMLDSLFGIRRRGRECFELDGAYKPGTTEPVVMRRAPDGFEDLAAALDTELVRFVEPGVHTKKGDALAKAGLASAVVLNPTGSGLAVYLNISLWDYLQARTRVGGGEKLRKFMGVLLGKAGVGPAAQTYVEGLVVPRTVKRILTSGRLSYAVILLDKSTRAAKSTGITRVNAESADSTADETAETEAAPPAENLALSVAFPAATNAYDMISGEYLGWGSQVVLSLRSDRAALLALLPYRVRRLDASVEVRQRTVNFSATVVIEDSRVTPGTHVIRAELTSPEGQLRPEYTRTFFASEGRASGQIRIGLTESGGAWTVTLTDVATHANATVTVVVQ